MTRKPYHGENIPVRISIRFRYEPAIVPNIIVKAVLRLVWHIIVKTICPRMGVSSRFLSRPGMTPPCLPGVSYKSKQPSLPGSASQTFPCRCQADVPDNQKVGVTVQRFWVPGYHGWLHTINGVADFWLFTSLVKKMHFNVWVNIYKNISNCQRSRWYHYSEAVGLFNCSRDVKL